MPPCHAALFFISFVYAFAITPLIIFVAPPPFFFFFLSCCLFRRFSRHAACHYAPRHITPPALRYAATLRRHADTMPDDVTLMLLPPFRRLFYYC